MVAARRTTRSQTKDDRVVLRERNSRVKKTDGRMNKNSKNGKVASGKLKKAKKAKKRNSNQENEETFHRPRDDGQKKEEEIVENDDCNAQESIGSPNESNDDSNKSDALAGSSGTPHTRSVKSFYGKSTPTQSIFNPETLRERLRELSFEGRKSFAPTPDERRVVARTKRVQKRVGTRALRAKKALKIVRKESVKKIRKSCCNRKGHFQPESLQKMKSTVIALRRSPRKQATGKKFFKHHFPASQFKIYYKGGILKVAPHTPSGTKKGPINFDYKDNNISHIAEEGGKCDNFGLESLDDLERTGIPRRSLLTGDLDGLKLRKRKAPTTLNNNTKRKRPSMWKYEEDKAACKKIPSGLTLQNYEDSQLREKFGFPDVWVRLERLPEPKQKRQSPKTQEMIDDSKGQIPAENDTHQISTMSTTNDQAQITRRSPRKSRRSKVEIPSREPSPVSIDLSSFQDLLPCASPVYAQSSPSTPERTTKANTVRNSKMTPLNSRFQYISSTSTAAIIDPIKDAFGFSRRIIEAPLTDKFFKPLSPIKKPKGLTPKVEKSDQPKIKQALEGSIRRTSTPVKKQMNSDAPRNLAAELPTPAMGRLQPHMTSTPYDGENRASAFYGKKSNTAGFSGFKRLIDHAGARQLQIDAGQKRYGAKECPTCGMVFSQGEADDEREHEKFHNKMISALQFKGWKSGRILDMFPDKGRVFLVLSKDAKYMRDKIAEILRLANSTVGFDEESIKIDPIEYPERQFAFFATNSGKIISIMAIEPATSAHRTVPNSEHVMVGKELYPVKFSVFFAWTLPEYRRKGYAGVLLYRLRVILADSQSDTLTFDEIAFADPTPDLQKFVCSLSGQDTFLVTAQ